MEEPWGTRRRKAGHILTGALLAIRICCDDSAFALVQGQNGYSKFQRDWEPYQHYVADKDRGKMSKHTGAKVSQQLNPEGRGWQGYFYKSHRLNNISRRACRWRSRDILTEINTGPRWVLPGLPHSRLTQAGWYVGHGGPNESTCVKAASTAREKAGFSLRFVLDFMVEQLRKGPA